MKDIYYLIKSIILFLRNKGIFLMLILFLLIWWLFIEPSSYAASNGSVDILNYYKLCVDSAQLKYMYTTIRTLNNSSDVNSISSVVKDDITYMFKTGDLAFYNYDMSNLFSAFDTDNPDYVYAVRIDEMDTTSSANVWKPTILNGSFESTNYVYPGYKITSGSYTRVNPGGLFSNYTYTDNLDGVTAYYPSGLRGYYNSTFYDWASSVYNGTFKISDSSYWLSLIYTQNNETNEKLDDIKNEISETNDFLQDDSVDDSSMNLPSDNNNDVTSDYFNSIFEKFRTYMTTSTPIDIEIPIPFADSSFSISSTITQEMVDGTIIQPLLSSVWYFLVGLFILKDIQKLLEKVKNGDIMTSTDTNVKADML